ncbi:Cupredoxin superfamily protein [Prunus dulcis]|uniref:Cupredoxin superfamily protein n=1 Tax=Prunus dulcis TaxID=3755 RepID=A0A4Y1QRP1_PRUDU|nr:Cupredoxin superfamily protein [Prunus dulcis]
MLINSTETFPQRQCSPTAHVGDSNSAWSNNEALHGIDTYVTWMNRLPSKHILPWDPTIPTAELPLTRAFLLWCTFTVPSMNPRVMETQTHGLPLDLKPVAHFGPTHPGNLWYHDHAMGLTRVNLLAGLIGAYIIRHPQVEGPLGLPRDEFDRTLIVFDRSFRTDGSIYMNSTGNNPSIHPQWQPEYFGDAIIVNGKAWPRLTVRRRKYRFRIINASNARFFRFFFTNGLRFTHVGSDSAYLGEPVETNDILLGPSEITDVVVDFSKSKNDNAILANDAPYPYPKVMKFFVVGHSAVDTSRIPKRLISYPVPDLSSVSRTRYIAMYEYTSDIDEPTHLYLNGKPYEAPVTEIAKAGTSEELVDVEKFKDCMNKTNDAVNCNISKYARGKKIDVPAYEKGWKNVFKMSPGSVTKILLRFAYLHTNASYEFDPTAEPGYVYHCHILDHEDNAMMRPLKVVR